MEQHRRASQQGLEAARRFVKRLASAPDSSQWPVLVRRMLSPASAMADGADRLQGLFEATLAGWGRDGWIAFTQVFCAGGLDERLVGRLFSEASELGYVGLRAMLLVDALEAGRQVDPTSLPPDDVLGSLTLGERKARARRTDPNLIDRLLLDPDPTVIRILLANARVTEPLVVRLCAKRPHRAKALAEVARSHWVMRRDVQTALAFNPYTPARVVCALLPLLNPNERGEVRRAQGTHAAAIKVAEVCDTLSQLPEA